MVLEKALDHSFQTALKNIAPGLLEKILVQIRAVVFEKNVKPA